MVRLLPRLAAWLGLSAAVIFVAACGGGGGGGGGATIVGRVLQVATGGPPSPQASVQAGSDSTLTAVSDGSFQVGAPGGASSLTVDTRTAQSGVWIFSTPPASGVTDVGDLWVGPERVTLSGTVRDTTSNDPVPGATVSFGGRFGTTDASGRFGLLEVAYSSSTQTAFWGIVGTARATGYFKTDFSAAPNVASGGTVEVGDVFITPLSDPNPPGPPFNIWGVISAPGGPQGTIVRLRLASVDIRVFNVGADGKYFFFVVPGSYTINAAKGALTAPDQMVTLTQPNEVIRRDFTLQ